MANEPKPLRCAIYTRKSTEHGLDQEFNSLDAQREACEAYVKSQSSWAGGLSPSTMTIPPTPAAILSVPPSKSCSPTSKPAGSTSSWSTRSIA